MSLVCKHGADPRSLASQTWRRVVFGAGIGYFNLAEVVILEAML